MQPAPKLSVVPSPNLPKIERNLRGLVDALFDEIDGMRDGTGSAKRVQAVCTIAGRVNALINTEIKLRKAAGSMEGATDRVKALTG